MEEGFNPIEAEVGEESKENKHVVGEVVERFWDEDRTHRGGQTRKYQRDVDMYLKILEYIELNRQTAKETTNKKGEKVTKKEPMTQIGLLHHLGLTRTGMRPYKQGQYDVEGNRFASLWLWAREVIENDWTVGAATGAVNERTAHMALSVHYGWIEEKKLSLAQEITYTPDEASKQLIGMIEKMAQLPIFD